MEYDGELPAGFGSDARAVAHDQDRSHGIKVVEQGTFITGPACGMLLGDLGADVIKVEQPGTGDPFRAFKGGLYSPHFQTYNRNKRSIALDTKSAGDRERLDALIAERRRLHPELPPRRRREARRRREQRLRALNPRLVYCSISGFGADRPGGATGPPTTPSRRRRAASSTCSSIPRTRASSARRSPIR